MSWLKNFEDGNCPSPGILIEFLNYPELSLISFVNTIEKF
jgi:hypothetical protein